HAYAGMRTGGFIDEDVNLNPGNMYTGLGGALSPQVRFRLTGLWGGLADIDAPAGGSTIIQGGCANGDCGGVLSNFRLEAWPANGKDAFYRSLNQYYDNAVIAGFTSGPQLTMQGGATGQTMNFGMNVPLYLQTHQLKQLANATDSGDAVNLGQMQAAIAAGGGSGTTLPALIAAVATDASGNVGLATFTGLEGILATDPHPTYDGYKVGDGSPSPTPGAGEEATLLVDGQISRKRPDGTTSVLCDASGEGGCVTTLAGDVTGAAGSNVVQAAHPANGSFDVTGVVTASNGEVRSLRSSSSGVNGLWLQDGTNKYAWGWSMQPGSVDVQLISNGSNVVTDCVPGGNCDFPTGATDKGKALCHTDGTQCYYPVGEYDAVVTTTTSFPMNVSSSLTVTELSSSTSFTMAAGIPSQPLTLMFCQNSTGGWGVTPPAILHGFFNVGTTPSKCSSQSFVYSTFINANLNGWYATSSGVINQ
ncbi:MAG: hypothetical protein ACRYGG_09340, partial [Janthinobacterium lividum]